MSVLVDLERAARALAQRPWFTVAAVTSLAFGIGANVTVFSIVNAVIVRPLPYADAERLVFVRAANARLGVARAGVTLDELEAIRARVPSIRGAGVVREMDFNVGYGDRSRRVRGAVVSAATLATVGAIPQVGGTFTEDDDRPSAAARVIVSDAFWRSTLGATPDLSRAVLRIDGERFVVTGVMAPGFRFPERAELWLASGRGAVPSARTADRGVRSYQLVARLAPSSTFSAAQAELATLARALDAGRAARDSGWTLSAISAASERGENARPAVYLLFALVTCVLLVACANLASLVMIRAVGRQRELAIRSALGASQGRLVWHGMAESVVLAATGGALALGVAVLGVRAVRLAFPADTLPFWMHFTIDWRVVVYALGLAIATTIGFGLVPALWGARRDPATALQIASRSATDVRSRRRVGEVLVAGQVAVSLVLVVAAALLGAALRSMRSMDLGYQPAGLLTTDIEPHGRRYAGNDARGAFYLSLAGRLRAIPGVGRATGFDVWGTAPIALASRQGVASALIQEPTYSVLPDYFQTLRVRVIAGRSIAASDVRGAPPVAVVNETFARRYWPNDSVVGRQLRIGDTASVWLTVVGVVGDVRRNPADLEREAHVYVSALQFPPRRLQLLLRVEGAGVQPAAVNAAAQDVDRDEPLGPITTMEEQIGEWTAPARFFGRSLMGFAFVAMLIAAAGVYGVVAGGVAARTREFGIRLALGATPGRIVALAVRRGARLSALGAVVGLAGAVAVSRVIVTLPFGVERVDATIVVSAALGLITLALGAAYAPARRAGRVEPTIALSDDR